MKGFLYLITFLIPVTCFSQFYTADELDSIINDAISKFDVPGLAISIVQGNATIVSKGYGIRKIGTEDAVDENTAFGIASISKSFTALCLAILKDREIIDWNDKVNKHLPYFKMYDPYAGNEMTIRDLLIHNSGLPSVSGGIYWYGSDYSRKEIIEKIRYIKPVSSFRSEFAYQNLMYLVAGEIVSAASGLSWDEFVQQNVLGPLHMDHSGTTYASFMAAENRACPHIMHQGELVDIVPMNYDNLGPAASVYTTANDISQYLKLLINKGKTDGRQLLSEYRIREIFEPRILVPVSFASDYKSIEPKYCSYGFGWWNQDYRKYVMYEHSGGIDGMSSLVFIIPELEFGCAILSNQPDSDLIYALESSFIDKILGIRDMDWIALEYANISNKGQEEKKEKLPGTKPSLEIEEYAGFYFDKAYGDILIEYRNGALYLNFSHTKILSAKLSHHQYDTFKLNWEDIRIPGGFLTFTFNSDHRVTGFTLEQPDLLDVDFSELEIKKVK